MENIGIIVDTYIHQIYTINMKENYIAKLKKDEEITDFFIVTDIAIKTGSNRKQFLDVTLSDNTGSISSKKWDLANDELEGLNKIEKGDILKVKAKVTEWNGFKQLRITKLRKAVDQDGLDKRDFIKAAPEEPQEMFDFIMGKAKSIEDSDLKKIAVHLLQENEDKLLYYPAASSNHHAEYAGLLYHVKRMLMMGEKALEVYTNLNRSFVITGVIIHDIEKLNEMVADTDGTVSEYSFEGQMLGHLVQGVKLIDRLGREFGTPYEKMIMLEHMILSHHYEPEFGSPRRPLFPEAELLHYLDVLDARMYDMEEALYSTERGDFSDRVWTLNNRKLYKFDED